MQPSIGRILHYKLSEQDVARIPKDGAHYNPHDVGQVLPLLVCLPWPNECGADRTGVNGQVFLDGSSALWVTSVCEGTGNGQWSWPPKV